MAGFSSRGPRVLNGGLKPEVTAPGVDITAARAAGTNLGPTVDEHYTTISGTSMATPHVAGLAAMLKQQHPTWDGERLKSAIANSTVPVSDATAFDTGTGRIDALRAIQADVLAPASLHLGSFAWPYAEAEPTSTTLRYTNTTDTDVTLDLALAGQDGSAVRPGTMALTNDQLVVPANGEAVTDITLDPRIGEPGSYSGVVTATGARRPHHPDRRRLPAGAGALRRDRARGPPLRLSENRPPGVAQLHRRAVVLRPTHLRRRRRRARPRPSGSRRASTAPQ